MLFLQLLLVATAAALDVMVTCSSAPRYYTIDGMPNRQLSIHAGESIFFHFDVGCGGHPLEIRRIDGTPYGTMGPHTLLSTSAATPECMIYACMVHPLTMTGTISVIGGAPCGATVTAAVTLYNRPIITPLPAPLYTIPAPVTTIYQPTTTLYPLPSVPVTTMLYPVPAVPVTTTLYSLPTTTTTTIYPLPTTLYPTTTIYPLPSTTLYASGSLTTLYPPVCPMRACPVLRCLAPAYSRADIMADGCQGCPYCFAPLMRTPPCVGLYCLPCCPSIVVPGQACRNCVVYV